MRNAVTRVAAAIGLLGAVGLASCDNAAPTREFESRSAEPATRVSAPVEASVNKPSRGRVLGGQSVARVVAWPDPSARDASARSHLSADALRAVDDAPLPILAPAAAELLARTTVTSGARWAAWSTDHDGLHVRLNASGQAKVHPHIKPVPGTHEVRSGMGFVMQNEGIWVASWIEHGVAYQLELECADTSNAACADADALLAIVDTLAFIGGRGT